jgi:hypothetical protein
MRQKLPPPGVDRSADAHDVAPDLLGFVVGGVDGDPEALGIQPEDLGVQLPRPPDRVGLEVVAEAEVAEHLEEREVPVGAADVVEVVVLATGAYAFLHRRRALEPRRLVADAVRLNGTIPAFVNSRVSS